MGYIDYTPYRNELVNAELILRRLGGLLPPDHEERIAEICDKLVELQREV